MIFLFGNEILPLIHTQVALKRQQAAEDAIALGLRMASTSPSENCLGYLPPGPVYNPQESESENDATGI